MTRRRFACIICAFAWSRPGKQPARLGPLVAPAGHPLKPHASPRGHGDVTVVLRRSSARHATGGNAHGAAHVAPALHIEAFHYVFPDDPDVQRAPADTRWLV